jgi:hypothetical protein
MQLSSDLSILASSPFWKKSKIQQCAIVYILCTIHLNLKIFLPFLEAASRLKWHICVYFCKASPNSEIQEFGHDRDEGTYVAHLSDLLFELSSEHPVWMLSSWSLDMFSESDTIKLFLLDKERFFMSLESVGYGGYSSRLLRRSVTYAGARVPIKEGGCYEGARAAKRAEAAEEAAIERVLPEAE